MRTSKERRRRRSADATQALNYQLETCCQEGALAAMIIADETGTCLASAGAHDVGSEIAAAAPMIGRRTERFRGVLLHEGGQMPVAMRRVDVDGYPLFICAIGAADDRSEQLAARAANTASRLLAA
jgi:hypothetical protein